MKSFKTCILLFAAIIVLIPTSQAATLPFHPDSPFHSFYAESIEPYLNNLDRTQGNYVGIVDNGDLALQLRIHLIRNATQTIDIQTFIWANDECGALVFKEILDAAHRGVKVRLIIDHIASLKDSTTIAYLTEASPNIEIKYYRPAAKRLKSSIPLLSLNAVIFAGSINQRMHNKMFIIDGAVGLTGGRNFDNHYYNRSTTYNFKDRDVYVLGPVLNDARASFERYWDFNKSVSSDKLLDVVNKLDDENLRDESFFEDLATDPMFDDLLVDIENNSLMHEQFIDTLYPAKSTRFLADAPGKNKGLWLFRMWASGKVTEDLKNVISTTEHELIMQTPYVVVNRWARRTFKKIRKKSPDVRFVVSTNSFAATDNILAYSANYRLRSPYIKKLGFQIYEFMPHPEIMQEEFPEYADMKKRAVQQGKDRAPFFCVHSKSFVMDQRISFIGTYNLDSRSFNLNSEEGFLIEDEAIAKALRATILRDCAPENSWVIAKQDQQEELGEVNRTIEGISRLLPIDLWPVRYTSSFQLRDGYEPVPPDHAEFYSRYEDIGQFPGSDDFSGPEALTLFYKSFGKFMTPAL
ncbi:MAG: phospholipase D family protein [Candidatus Hydrogenedentota bacterium]